MTQDTALAYNQEAGAWFFEAVQEMMSGASHNLVLGFSGHTVTIAAGGGHDQVSISIGGFYRWITTPLAVPVSGAAGLYDVYATAATPNDYGTDQVDHTDRTFGLAFVAHGSSAPGSVFASRLIAELDFDGTNIVWLSQIVPPQPTLNPAAEPPKYIRTWSQWAPAGLISPGVAIEFPVDESSDETTRLVKMRYRLAVGTARLHIEHGVGGAPTSPISDFSGSSALNATTSWQSELATTIQTGQTLPGVVLGADDTLAIVVETASANAASPVVGFMFEHRI